MTMTTESKTDRIRTLNDAFRRTFVGGAVMITAGVEAMPRDQRRSLLQKVRSFDAFGEDNDPHGEHDFGAVNEAATLEHAPARGRRVAHSIQMRLDHVVGYGPRAAMHYQNWVVWQVQSPQEFRRLV